MLRDAAVDLIALRLGSRTDLNDRIIAEMVLAQATTLEGGSFLPWFLLTDDTTTLDLVVDAETVALPSDFLRAYDEENEAYLWYENTALDDPWVDIPKDDYNVIKQRYAVSGDPIRHSLEGDNLLFRPIPDTVRNLRIKYYKRAVTLTGVYGTNNVENAWLKHAADWLIATTGIVMASEVQNAKKLKEFQDEATAAQRRVWVTHEARIEAGRRRQMGSS